MRYIIFQVILLFTTNTFAEQYLCIAEQSTGFMYSESQKTWTSADFKADEKFTLSNSSGKYELRTSGFDEPLATCGAFDELGTINCYGMLSFVFNKKNGRFTESSNGLYHLVGSKIFPVDTKGVPTPNVVIGQCTAF